MARYTLRKLDPQARGSSKYNSADDFNTFRDLWYAIRNRKDIWYGGANFGLGNTFHVLNDDGDILFTNEEAYMAIEKRIPATLSALVEYRNS